MHRTKREFVNEVLIRKRPFPKLPALVSPPGGYAGITWTQPHANKAVEAGVHTRFVHSSIISATTPPPGKRTWPAYWEHGKSLLLHPPPPPNMVGIWISRKIYRVVPPNKNPGYAVVWRRTQHKTRPRVFMVYSLWIVFPFHSPEGAQHQYNNTVQVRQVAPPFLDNLDYTTV